MKKIKVDKVILYYMDRVDPDGNPYRFYVYKGMASEIEYFCTEEAGNMTIPIGEGKYIEIAPREIVKIPVRGYRKLAGIWKCEGQWWDAVTDRAREELEKEGNPFSKMMLIGVSSVDRLSDCYVYYGLWASESKIEEMIADYKGRIYEYYEFKEDVIDKINETLRKSYIQSWKERIIRSGMRQKGKDVFESPDGLYIEMVYENKAFVPYRPIKEIQDLPIDAKYIPLLTRIFGENILAEIGGDKIFITTGKYAVNFWCWKK